MTTAGALRLLALALVAIACRPEENAMTPPAPAGPPPAWVERLARPRTPSDGPPPLLVMLHGIGADENDLFDLAAALDSRLTVVSLRAPGRYGPGFSWFHIDFRPDGTVIPDFDGARTTVADLVRWLAAAPARLGTDPARTFLLGFSQGAMMSLAAMRTAPEQLAGVIALSGRNPGDAFDTASALVERVARVPLFVAHGSYDDVLPVENGRQIRAAYEPRQRDFTYREYAVAHGIAPAEVRDVAAWLAAHLDAPAGAR